MSAKVVRDGKVAVLVSPGFGAGWSTWCGPEAQEWALFAPELVEWVEAGKPGGEAKAKELAAAKFGPDYYFCALGWEDLKVEWLPQGTAFEVDEYDGSESLDIYSGPARWVVA